MNCSYCNKQFSTEKILKKHQQSTKSCIVLREQICPDSEIKKQFYQCEICKKQLTSKSNFVYHTTNCKIKKEIETHIKTNLFECIFCKKKLSSKQNTTYHQNICKNKNNLLSENKPTEPKPIETKPIQSKLVYTTEQSVDDQKLIKKEYERLVKTLKENNEDALEQIHSDVRSKLEDMEFEAKHNDKLRKEQITKIEEKIRNEYEIKLKMEIELLEKKFDKKIEELSKAASIVTYKNIEKQEITNHITNNITNHITIFQLSPERIGNLFAQQFEPEHLLKGQTEYAIMIQSILNSEKVLYGVADRSRNRCYYGNEREQYIEDPNCMTLHTMFLPLLREMKSVFRYCINSPHFLQKEEALKGFLDNLSVLENGQSFQTQLCKLLPSIKGKDKIQIKEEDNVLEKKDFCKKTYATMKEQMVGKDPHVRFPEEPKPIQLYIGDVKIGLLYKFYKKYQTDRTYRIPSLLEDSIRKNPDVEKEFELYVKEGLHDGKKIILDDYYDGY